MLMMHPKRSFRGPAFHVVGAMILAAVILGLLLLLWPKKAGAQTAAARSVVIVVLKGNDTLVVERIQRTARTVSAVIGGPGQPLLSLEYSLGADHRVPAMSFSVQGLNAPADAPPLQRGTLELARDSAFLSIMAGGQTRNLRLGTQPGALPVSNNDLVTMEQAIRIARAAKVTSLDVPLFALASGQTLQGRLELISFGGDSARFSVAGNVTTMSIDADGNVTGGEVAAQGVRIVVLEGEAAARVSFGRADYSAPAGAPYVAEEVTVRTPAGHSLSGTLTLPRASDAAPPRLPAVVTITGSGLQDRDEFIPVAGGFRFFRQVADTLSRRGIAVLRLDDRGIGGSGGDVNGTSADFAEDIRAAVAYLRTRPDIDPTRIALVGHSEGGIIAPMVAAKDPRLAAVVLMAGTAYTGRKIIDYQLENSVRGNPKLTEANRDSMVKAIRASFATTEAKAPWMQYFLTYDPLPTVRLVKQPVLILQGATDQQVRAEEARELDRALRAAGNKRVTLEIFPDRNHLFLRDSVGHPSGYAELKDGKVDGEVLGRLADWLVTTLKAR